MVPPSFEFGYAAGEFVLVAESADDLGGILNDVTDRGLSIALVVVLAVDEARGDAAAEGRDVPGGDPFAG